MPDDRRLRSEVTPDDWSQGPADAPVTLLEYGDLECSYCGRAHPEIKALLADYPEQLRYIFRHFPISSLHPHAQAAAQASEAAGAQGKFWQLFDLLMTNQQALEPDDLRRYAEQIGLDVERFERDLAEQTYAEQVKRDFRNGISDGVNGTPTLFFNGTRYDGPREHAALAEAVAALLDG